MFVEVSSIIYADITKIWHNYRIEKMILFLHCNICIWMPSWLKSHVAGLRWPELTEVPSLVSALTIQIYTTYQAIFLSPTPHTVSFKETQCQAFYAVCKSHSLEQLASNIFLNFLFFFFLLRQKMFKLKSVFVFLFLILSPGNVFKWNQWRQILIEVACVW